MEKKTLDLGRLLDSWDDYHNPLKESILNCFNHSFPFYLSDKDIYKALDDAYNIPHGSNDRGELGITCSIGKIREEFFSSKTFFDKKAKTLVFHEWSSFEALWSLNKNVQNLIEKGDLKPFIDMQSHYTESCISVKNTNDTIVFSYPTIHYADYALVFEKIFSLESLSGRNSDEQDIIDVRRSNKPSENNHYLYKLGPCDETHYCDISLKGSNYKNVLYHSAYYLLDFILGFLAANLRGAEQLSDGINIETLSFQIAIYRLKYHIDYNPNTSVVADIFHKLGNEKPGINTDEVQIVFRHLIHISDHCNSENLHLPTYDFYMPRLFELYSYWFLREGLSSLHYQKATEDDLHPDMTASDMGYYFDAKYKFQYDNTYFVELNDVNRMFRYITGENGDKVKNSYGVFVYPDMRQSSELKDIDGILKFSRKIIDQIDYMKKDQSNNHFLKIGIPFPIKGGSHAGSKQRIEEEILKRVTNNGRQYGKRDRHFSFEDYPKSIQDILNRIVGADKWHYSTSSSKRDFKISFINKEKNKWESVSSLKEDEALIIAVIRCS